MKHSLTKIVAALFVAGALASCTTTYDAYGRPVQSVDPGLAVAGIAAAGLIGYALADGDHHSHYRHNYYRPAPHRYYYNHGPYYCY